MRYVFKNILILLILANFCFAATYYVDPARPNDTGNGTTPATAEKTVAAGINDCGDGDTLKLITGTYNTTTQGANWYILFDAGESAESITIEPYTTSVTLTTASNQSSHLFWNGADGGSVIFNNIIFSGETSAATSIIRMAANTSNNITFNNCTFSNYTSIPQYWAYFVANTGGVDTSILTLDGCTSSVAYSSSTSALLLYDCKRLIIKNCTLDLSSAAGPLLYSGANELYALTCINNTISMPTAASKIVFNISTQTPATQDVEVCYNTVTNCGGFVISATDQTINHWRINYNTITTTPTVAGNIINLGHSSLDVGDGGGPLNYLAGGEVIGNTINVTTGGGSNSSHPLMIGKNVHGWKVTNNKFTNNIASDYGCVVKGKYNTVCNNYIKGHYALYLTDGQYNTISNNTVEGTSTVTMLDNAYTRSPVGNVLEHNIFYANGAAYAASINDPSSGIYWNNFWDYNIYYGGSTAQFQIDDAGHSTIAALTADWLANWTADQTRYYSIQYNDQHSLMINPRINDNGYSRSPDCINYGRQPNLKVRPSSSRFIWPGEEVYKRLID